MERQPRLFVARRPAKHLSRSVQSDTEKGLTARRNAAKSFSMFRGV
jgi:hypothetical protein